MSVSRFFWWLRAARPPAAINLLPPLFYGQAIALQQGTPADSTTAAWLLAYGLANQLYIVFCNDWADRVADRLNRDFTLVSGGSRALVEGQLPPRALLRAGLTAAAAMVGLGLLLAPQRPLLPPLVAAAIGLLWAYSLPPLRLNYHGGGEALQAIGVGLLLPLIGFYTQAGTFADFPWRFLPPFFALHLASALATTIPDWRADRQGGKKTVAALWGPGSAAAAALLSAASALALSVWLLPQTHGPLNHLPPACLLARRLHPGPAARLYFALALLAAAALYPTPLIIAYVVSG